MAEYEMDLPCDDESAEGERESQNAFRTCFFALYPARSRYSAGSRCRRQYRVEKVSPSKWFSSRCYWKARLVPAQTYVVANKAGGRVHQLSD